MLKRHQGKEPGADRFGSVEHLKLKRKMRHFSSLIWLQNARNPIAEDLNLKKFPARSGPQTPYGGRLWQSLSCTLSLKSRIHPRENNKLLHLVSTWPSSKCNCQTSYLIQFPHLAPFPAKLLINLCTMCKFLECNYGICFFTIFLTSSPSDGVQVFVVGIVSIVSLLLCIFTDLCRAQGMVLLDS